MQVTSSKEFQNFVYKQLTFQPTKKNDFILYHNENRPELGFSLLYSRPDYYDIGIAEYTIPHDFSVSFKNPSLMMRFGTVYEGVTTFQLEKSPVSSFTPSSFLVVENDLSGKQSWKKGQHFHGTEITIYEPFFRKLLSRMYPECISLSDFIYNHTYPYLPLDIIKIIQQIETFPFSSGFNGIYMDSKILECMAILTKEIKTSSVNVFTNQLNYGEICIGSNRKLTLTAMDVKAIKEAHNILTEDSYHPPTINALSSMVHLNAQKLKAGFQHIFHMTIGEYTTSLRMTTAANLLVTTERSIEDIAYSIGYSHCPGFIAMFKKKYGMTPKVFRKRKIG